MKKILLLTVVLCVGCSEYNPKNQAIGIGNTRIDDLDNIMTESSYEFIEIFNRLNDQEISRQEKKKLLCIDFKYLFENKYLPAYLEYESLTDGDVSSQQMLELFQNESKRYSQDLKIECNVLEINAPR